MKSKGSQLYEHDGIVGTLPELCFIFSVDQKQVETLLKLTNINDAVSTVRSTSRVKGLHRKPESVPYTGLSSLTAEQIQWVQDHEKILTNFLRSRCITDEDMMQDMYLHFCWVAQRVCMNDRKCRQKTRVATELRRYWMHLCRYQVECRHRLVPLTELDSDRRNMSSNPPETQVLHMERERVCYEVVSGRLTQREHEMLMLYFGRPDADPQSYRETGRHYGVSGSRASQIINRALRKLRHPSTSKHLQDFR